MINKQFVHKVAGWVSASSMGMTLAASVHAGDVRALAQAKPQQYALAHVQSVQAKPKIKLTAEAALEKGLNLLNRAKTANENVQAFKYVNYAAKKGLPEAMFQCALMYLDNQYTPADDERAMKLLQQASEQGHEQAEIALNYIKYADGGIGC